MNKRIFSLALVVVSAAAGIYFRFYPKLLPVFDMLAQQEVYEGEKAALRLAVQKNYPDIADPSVNKIVNQLFKDTLRDSKDRIRLKISARSRQLKERFRNPEGHLYVTGIDSYYWLRLLENLLTQGHIGDRVTNGVEYDDLIGNPIDAATKKNIHIWLGFVFYKTAVFFFKDASLEEVLFYIPVFLSVIIALFSFTTAKRLGASDFGAFFASVAINLSPFFLSRSIGEWFDTDIYNVLLPLLVFGTFLFAFGKRKIPGRLFFCGLSGLFLAFYASTWKGWWYIFDIMLLAGFLFVLNQKLIIKEEEKVAEELKDQVVSFSFFFIFSTLFIILLNGFSVWKDFIAEPLRLSTILKVTPQTVWPNVYLTVAELSPVKSTIVVESLGGNFVFFGAMLCLIYILLAERGIRDSRFGYGVLTLVFWIVGPFYIALEAMRFVLLLVVPVGLAFGLAITKIYQAVQEKAPAYLRQKAVVFLRFGVTIILAVFLVLDMRAINLKLLGAYPTIDDYWYSALAKIKKETPADAIIDSWWDFGHWFKAIAQRRVLFDGMTQNTPYAYWMASVFLTEDEQEAVGILRMINTSDNKAASMLEAEAGLSASKAVALIKKAVRLDRSAARQYLGTELPQEKAKSLIELLFPDRLPPVYLIISFDMIAKISAISYIGDWDFAKVDAWFKNKRLSKDDFYVYLKKNYNLTSREAEARYLEVSFLGSGEAKSLFSKPVGFFSGLAPAKQEGRLLFFDNGLVVDLDNHHAYVISDYPERRGYPKSLVYLQEGNLKEESFKDSNLKFSALMFKDGDQYKSLLLDPVLAKSMLVRLYFLKGDGLKAFKLWHKEVDEKGNAIYVYEVLWPPA